MGNLIWHEWSRYVAVSASLCEASILNRELCCSEDLIWASFWGMYFRKFFWDFIGGTLRDPGGLQPSPKVAFFITIIVKIPLVQLLSMASGFAMVAFEYPAPFLKGTAIHRSFVFRIVWLILQAFLAVLFYQGTNAALYSLVAAIGYGRAISLGETMEEAKNNRGRGGAA
ncbi:uncharacterized protein LAESUDRAFT_643259 [Laetiporus sulphureus 93-53]|uniref:DUF7727 domain-containing protein n=1 Tax=Laetiporus sulphureus 93-53 TaxID=1314785 RepID=A0A165GQP8_9APHY|nr:uncharacterized protein LAESUDRAFT_643259 [Laetiporus sulphureus 93-53]KZT10674.1 hypothetical protein LAESUDRAFT_643259 [Laetiporus sulphureus 93-53]